MKKVFSLIAPNPESTKSAFGMMAFISVLLVYHFSVNDIWTPNESFYAESVREMFESGNFLDIQYNYEPRYNKPPLTYWLIASSSAIFGLNEFGIRLPIILLTIASIWLTYKLGKHLYGQKAGFYSMVVMAFSLQLLAVKQYASPEIPLTFFFTLTIYWFIKAFDHRSTKYVMLSYIALGLTVLTKGFPYIFVIGGIVGLYTLFKNRRDLKGLWQDIAFLKLPLGILIIGGIGLSWVIFMYLKEGQEFWEVYYRETFGRALSKSTKGPRPFFYLGVISWSILPYTLTFIFAIVYWVRNRNLNNRNLWLWCWLAVMMVIFTIAKGKLPTYMIQAHSAVAVIIASVLIQKLDKKRWLHLSLLLPGILFIGGCSWFIIDFHMHWGYWLVPVALLFITAMGISHPSPTAVWRMLPFWTMAGFLLLLSSFLPKMEEFRPYDKIGEKVKMLELNKETPLLGDAWLIHNLPFYTERKMLRDQSASLINAYAMNESETLALIPTENLKLLNFEYETVWNGMIYDFASESQFFKFVVATNNALKGDQSRFKEFSLVLKR